MKILHLRFRNLNSLVGEWSIDFSDPVYTAGVIFAIIGPTGSGKTTVLDAISLALYGKTPRLNDITKTTNEIMSRQTGDCFAEVAFETSKGCFLCHWSQQRARHHADGDLQQPKHEIAELKTGKLLTSSKRKEVLEKIVEVTGLDFDQFTRSILLAQGGFAAFLDAKPDGRAPILEQITGTEIYSTISIKVHERTSEERKKLETQKAELGVIQVLTPEEEQTLVTDRVTKQNEAQELSKTLRSVQDSIEWRKRLDTIRQDLLHLTKAKEEFDEEKQRASSDLERLGAAKKARTIEAEFVKLTTHREQLEKDHKTIIECRKRQMRLSEEYEKAVNAEIDIADQKRKVAGEWEEESRLINDVRKLDIQLESAREACQQTEQELNALTRRCTECEVLITDREQQFWNTIDTLDETERYLSEHGKEATLKESLVALEEHLKHYRELEKKITKKNARLKIVIDAQNSAAQNVASQVTRREQKQKSLLTTSKNLDTVQEELLLVLKGEELAFRHEKETALRDDCEQINRLKQTIERSETIITDIQSHNDVHKKLNEALLNYSQTLTTLTSDAQQKETLVEQLEERAVLVARIRDLEKERLLLKADQPCPLCGSREHPFAQGTVPVLDEKYAELKREKKALKALRDHISRVSIDIGKIETEISQNRHDVLKLDELLAECGECWNTGCTQFGFDVQTTHKKDAITKLSEAFLMELAACHALIKQVNTKEKELQKIERAVNKGREELAGIDLVLQSARSDCKAFIAERDRLESEIATDTAELEQYQNTIRSILINYGYPVFDRLKIPAIKKDLVKRCKEYQLKIRQQQELINDKTRHSSDISAYTTSFAHQNAERNKKITQKNKQESALKECSTQRFTLYGKKSPAEEENRYKALQKTVDEQEKKCSGNKNALHSELRSVGDQLSTLTDTIKSGDARLRQLTSTFQNSLRALGFVDEATFKSALLPADTLDELISSEEVLRTRETQLQTSIRDKQIAQAREVELHLSERSLPQLSEDEKSLRTKHDETQNLLGAIDRKLKDNASEQERLQVRLCAVEAQALECSRWERLHELIGSADGKKFRNFAQGLTFEILIAHANRHLQKMSDRYLLIRNPIVPLDLNVIDNYQAGEIRSTKNLSGGESFILSLSLALGLSGMASHKVRIDSFFLDEGFGTLDDEALDTALVTLSGLQQEGKLIGVISHVAAIKERISTQIIVEKCSGGRSRLNGPGCKFRSY